MKKLFLVGLVLCCIASVGAQTEIKPYASEASVHTLVGQKTKVSGVYYKDVFDAPVIMIKGHTFYLLQNPPSKRTYSFPSKTRQATVSGVLYFYDHAQLNNADYGAIDSRYFFFNVDESDLKFGEAAVAEGQRPFMKTWKFNQSYTKEQLGGEDKWDYLDDRDFDEISDDEFGRMIVDAFSLGLSDVMRNSRLIVTEDSIHIMLPDKDTPPAEFELASIEGSLMKGSVTEQGEKMEVELEILSNGKLRFSYLFEDESDAIDFTFYFDP